MSQEKQNQIRRILSMYDRLKNGESLVKREEADRFQISEKSIQRDLENIRDYIEKEKQNEYLDYNRVKKAYVLQTEQPSWLKNEEIFAVLKVLIESRAFPKHEMDSIIKKLTHLAYKEDRTVIKQMMSNERQLYVELNHKKDLLDVLWQLSLAIQSKKVIRMHYLREFDKQSNERMVKPVGIIFSEYYFYLIAYPLKTDFDFPTIYRIDRIQHFEQTSVSFTVPYHERFQEGEFRKRVQFMYTGELMTIKFRFTGPSPQAVLDRLPTAKVIKKADDGVIFEAEVFGKGIKMWLLSQGEHVEVLEPVGFRDEIVGSVERILEAYSRAFNK
ncbi:helix-turn-helix transcriptional regulator [Solibacillus sp. FSL H8-0538]|uniref:helix-turn-helix transcriptional regulator n=1 Tax=Solibacillus sp. FSL H8-0538 TaxID=2921400 RepID=UPI0030F81364